MRWASLATARGGSGVTTVDDDDGDDGDDDDDDDDDDDRNSAIFLCTNIYPNPMNYGSTVYIG